MYETDDLYNAAAAKLGITPEALDEALGNATLVAGDSWILEIMADGSQSIMVPKAARGHDEVPEVFVGLTVTMTRLLTDPVFMAEQMEWAATHSGEDDA